MIIYFNRYFIFVWIVRRMYQDISFLNKIKYLERVMGKRYL